MFHSLFVQLLFGMSSLLLTTVCLVQLHQSLLGLLLRKSNCPEREVYHVALDRTVSQWSLQSVESLSLTSLRVR